MKRFQALVILAGLLWFSVTSLAAQPVLDLAEVYPESTQILSMPVKLWVNETTDWSLQLKTTQENELWYCFDNSWYPSSEPLTGDNSEVIAGRLVEIGLKMKIPWLTAGEYHVPLSFEMLKGNGLLMLEVENALWFLAVGSNEYWLDHSGEKYELANEHWLWIPANLAELTIYWRDHQLWPQQITAITPQTMATTLDEYAPRLTWQPSQLELTSGGEAEVKLALDVLTPGSRIYLNYSQGISPSEAWSFQGKAIAPCEVWLRSDADGYYLEIPNHVPLGQYQLSGKVLAGLGEQEQFIAVSYHKQQASLPILLNRGWFGETGRVIVYVSDGQSPVANFSLLLPNGEVKKTDHAGYLEFFSPPGVQRIIGVTEPDQVIWYDVAINETRYLKLELDEQEPNQGLVVWDFSWEPDFAWGLKVIGQDVEFRLQPHRDQVSFKQQHDGFAYNYQREGHSSEFTLTYSPSLMQYSEEKDGWTRSGTSTRQRLIYDDADYAVTIDVVRHPLTLSGITWQYKQPQWKLAVNDQYVKIRTQLDNYQIDAQYKYGGYWNLSLSERAAGWQLHLASSYIRLKSHVMLGTLPWQWQITRYQDESLQVALQCQLGHSKLELESEYTAKRWLPAIKAHSTFLLHSGSISVSLAGKKYAAQSLAELQLAYRLSLSSKSELLVHHGYRYHSHNSDLQQVSGIGLSHKLADLGYVQVGWDTDQGKYWRCALAVIGWN